MFEQFPFMVNYESRIWITGISRTFIVKGPTKTMTNGTDKKSIKQKLL